jgi:hypothetical protein
MAQFKSIILIMVVGLAILLSGCVGNQSGTPPSTPTVTPTATSTITVTPTITAPPTITATPTVITTPTPVSNAPMISGAISVSVRMKRPTYLGNGTYQLRSLQASISNTIGSPISLKAQIVSDGQILEEQSFTLQIGSVYSYSNKGQYTINSTNVSLWVFAEGYQPSEYKVTEIYS